MKKLFIGIGVFIFAVVALAGGNNSNQTVPEPATTMQATPTPAETPSTESTVEAAPTTTESSPSTTTSGSSTYTNVDGNTVQSPTYSDTVPDGATARCGDGSYSFSQHRSGTCSHHDGVAEWL